MSEELTRSSPHFKRYLLVCRRMRFEGAGTITLKRSSDAASHTLTVFDGLIEDIMADEISSATLITAVTVYW
jgi:hypothetical protein